MLATSNTAPAYPNRLNARTSSRIADKETKTPENKTPQAKKSREQGNRDIKNLSVSLDGACSGHVSCRVIKGTTKRIRNSSAAVWRGLSPLVRKNKIAR